VLRTDPARQGEHLALRLRWAWLRNGDLGPWTERNLSAAAPASVFTEALAALPLTLPALAEEALVPSQPAAFWELVELMGLRLENARIPEAIQRGRKLVETAPRCASAWLSLGNLLNRSLLDDPSASTVEDQAETETAYTRGLALVPDHSRGLFRLALFRAGAGNHREALDMLLEARKQHPRNPLLPLGIANAARNAGLLDLALKAADLHEHLTLPEIQPQSMQLLHLYREDLPRFEARLQGSPGQLRYSIVMFYRAYLRLLAGDRAGARDGFAGCETIERGIPNYLRLAKIFRLELEGHRPEALAQLKAMDLERTSLRVSDGEFTLRMAETAAFLGDSVLALELAERAYTQGFGCTRWYERSPLLAPIRGTARFASLLQHLRERQTLMESRFPPSRFGL
jgi:tetratricopeptide (TPR) repeat protein